ncbi:DUF4249 domain-containing protein [Arundinibacter roseus]|uniref:DUF4249 domain-containing protein n=1 Tax=Arundinibacter roseus TaxID=2070510 RepID=A0A4R4KD73_9BACT|nr:DUF4249 domain-containing protein [Arundinibacter roseus]TDB65827.1 DUF4249 domain-containing protein [Arundinibacter roseus]
MKPTISRLLLVLSLPLGILMSCIEQIKVPVRTEAPILVVDGGITNLPEPYQVRITQTGTFNLPSEAYEKLAVRNAQVLIEEVESGRMVSLFPVETEPGLYRTADPDFVGKIGNSYLIHITTQDNKSFQSVPERMLAAPPIKSLTARFSDQRAIVNDTPFGYEIFLETDDPAEQENYYRWTAFGYIRRESAGVLTFGGNLWYKFCWTPVFDNSITISSDAFTNGAPIREQQVYRSPIYTVGKHFIEVRQHALSREAYQYWRRFNDQRERIGTIFDPLPSPIIGNIFNAENPQERALGYFSATGISTKRLIVPGDTLSTPLLNIETSRFIAPGDCRRAFFQGSEERPVGWE